MPILVRLGLFGAMHFILGATLMPMDAGSDTDFIMCIVCGSRANADVLVNQDRSGRHPVHRRLS